MNAGLRHIPTTLLSGAYERLYANFRELGDTPQNSGIKNGPSEKPCHRTGNTHQQRPLLKCTRNRLHACGKRKPAFRRHEVLNTFHRRGRASPGGRLLDTYEARGRVILAGDHCQLPPTVKCYEAMKGGLAKSLMERIAENHPEAVTLLTVQYRMHEDIMRFSAKWFYNNGIEAAPDVRHRGILDYDTPIEWLDTSQILPENDADSNNTDTPMLTASRKYHSERPWPEKATGASTKTRPFSPC